MNYSPGGYYQPPENNNYQNNQNWHFGPKPPHFVPPDVWAREKNIIRKLSFISAAAVLLYILFSSVFVGGIQLLFLLLQNIGSVDYNVFSEKWNSAEFQYLFEVIYSIFLVGGPFFLMGYFAKKKGFLTNIPMGKPLNSKHLPIIIIGAFGLCLFSNIITSYLDMIVQLIFGFKMNLPEMPETPRNVGGILLFYLSTAVVPALIEEMALRGIIMQSLRRYGDMFAIVCSALIFGLMHCNLMQIPFACMAGIVIGYAVLITESVWTGVIIHFLNNAFTVTVSIVEDFYGIESAAYAFCNIAFYAVIAIGLVLTFVYFKKFNTRKLHKSPLVNIGKGFFGYVPMFSERISDGTLFKAFLLTPSMIIAFIAVLYETIVATIALS